MTQTTVVLGCSRTKRSSLAAVVETLAGRGNSVEVVSGLDETNEPWRDVIGRLGSNGVYVLCCDEQLNLRRVSELRKLLSDAGIPPSRAWAGPIDWDKPFLIIRNVEHLLESRNLAAPSPATRPAGPSEMSGTVVARPSLSNPTPMPQPAPAASETFVSSQIVTTRNWKPFAAIGGVALLVLAAAVPMLSSDDDEAVEDDAAVAVSGVASAEEETQAEPAPEPEAEPAPSEVEVEVEEPEQAAVVQELAAQATPAERDAVFNALATQKIRALDILLVGPEAKKLSKKGYERTAWLKFDDAEAFCTGLEIEGLGGWRLPFAGELASLTKNKMLAKGVYWSGTAGDSFGNDRVVWSTRKKRMKPMKRRYTGARTLCVRHIADSE